MSANGSNGSPSLTKKDFASDQETRWCPGCGDYAILATVQQFLPELGLPPERIVWVAGIGCAGRFAYYMDTYGVHGIHGRAPALATGLALARPDLSIWVVTGDGDALSIGGNHLIHALRRNVPIKILLFNNQIYGLTKGQYSPTSEEGKVTKSTPFGSLDHPFNPIALALGAEATFAARTVDTDREHQAEVLRAATQHPGSAFIEIYQNCNVFNDGAFDAVRDKGKEANQIRLEHGKPIRFGADGEQGVVRGADGRSEHRGRVRAGADALLVHDAHDPNPSLAFSLAHLSERPNGPTPIGIFRAFERPLYGGVDDQGAGGRPRGRRHGRARLAASLRRHLDRRLAPRRSRAHFAPPRRLGFRRVYDTLLFLHVLSAFALVATVVDLQRLRARGGTGLARAHGRQGAVGRRRPRDARLRDLARALPAELRALGWLDHRGDRAVGDRHGGREARRGGIHGARRDGPRRAAAAGAERAALMHWLRSLLVLALLVVMIYKPGA